MYDRFFSYSFHKIFMLRDDDDDDDDDADENHDHDDESKRKKVENRFQTGFLRRDRKKKADFLTLSLFFSALVCPFGKYTQSYTHYKSTDNYLQSSAHL